MGNVQQHVIDRFVNLYGVPKHAENVDAYMAEWERALGAYDNSTLEKAVSASIDENHFHAWPAIGTVRSHCEFFKPQLRLPTYRPEIDKRPAPTEQDRERWSAQMAEFRKSMKEADAAVGRTSEGKFSFQQVQRPAFEAMQRISDITKRITGEHQE